MQPDIGGMVDLVLKVSQGGVSLIPLIIGLVQFAKKLGLKDRGCIIAAFALGIGFVGTSSAVSQGLIPTSAVPWVNTFFGALAGGVVAMASVGLYDVAQSFKRP